MTNGRVAKKIRKEIRKQFRKGWLEFYKVIKELPFMNRLGIAWYILFGR